MTYIELLLSYFLGRGVAHTTEVTSSPHHLPLSSTRTSTPYIFSEIFATKPRFLSSESALLSITLQQIWWSVPHSLIVSVFPENIQFHCSGFSLYFQWPTMMSPQQAAREAWGVKETRLHSSVIKQTLEWLKTLGMTPLRLLTPSASQKQCLSVNRLLIVAVTRPSWYRFTHVRPSGVRSRKWVSL